jgi:hypothetical protein
MKRISLVLLLTCVCAFGQSTIGNVTLRIAALQTAVAPCPVIVSPSCSVILAITADATTAAFRITTGYRVGAYTFSGIEVIGAHARIPSAVLVPIDISAITSVVVEELKVATAQSFQSPQQ